MSRFKIGDEVKITGVLKEYPWIFSMDECKGLTGTVTEVTREERYGRDSVHVAIAGEGGFYYSENDIELIPLARPALTYWKPMQTLGNSKPVKIVSSAGVSPYSFLGYIGDDPVIRAWSSTGDTPPGTHYRKIENVPEPREEPQMGYVNVYQKGDGTLRGTAPYHSKEYADSVSSPDRVGRLKIELKEEFHA